MTDRHFEDLYESGKGLYFSSISISDAKNKFGRLGVNPNSAADYIYCVKGMLAGTTYKRAVSLDAAGKFIGWIHRDFGKEGLERAIKSTRGNIEFTNHASPGLEGIVLSYESLLNRAQNVKGQLDDVAKTEMFTEGERSIVTLERAYRNKAARDECIRIFGLDCAVCGFNFEKAFGEIGKGFIHVHHLSELSSADSSIETIPEKDLRPVCPNCHWMLHQKNPPYSIKELKGIRKG